MIATINRTLIFEALAMAAIAALVLLSPCKSSQPLSTEAGRIRKTPRPPWIRRSDRRYPTSARHSKLTSGLRTGSAGPSIQQPRSIDIGVLQNRPRVR